MAHNEGSLSVIEKKLEFVLHKVDEPHTTFLTRDGRVVPVIPRYSRDHHVKIAAGFQPPPALNTMA